MSLNNTFLQKTNNLFNYAATGISSHFAGAVVEIVTIPLLTNLPYGHLYRVFVAKVLHELTESFFSASTTINIYEEGCNPLQAFKDLTKPIWNSPLETILAGVSSYGFELIAIKVFGLNPCNHVHAHGVNHNHPNLLLGHVIKGLASVAGSFAMTHIYHSVTNTYSPDEVSQNSLTGVALIHDHDL